MWRAIHRLGWTQKKKILAASMVRSEPGMIGCGMDQFRLARAGCRGRRSGGVSWLLARLVARLVARRGHWRGRWRWARPGLPFA